MCVHKLLFPLQNKKAKGEINLDDINAVLVPEKMGKKAGMQLTYIKDGTTRNIYVHADKTMVCHLMRTFNLNCSFLFTNQMVYVKY